jgi:hypothetical protein|tara:strand:+ start:236 stop:997 length:762 start_codon:yes stop_codon:yes gene_type:complete
MNFFFGIENSEFTSEIQIPTFQNKKAKSPNILLYKTYIENNKWKIEELKNKKVNNDFFLLKEKDIKNTDIYFLAFEKDFQKYNNLKLQNFNKFTDTTPAFRANFKIILKNGGFSSYQSEYPYPMVEKRGTILSSVSSLANREADTNYIFIKNIFTEPVIENFNAYLVNIINKTVEEKIILKTNYTNSFKLKKSLIRPEIFLVTEKYLAIPMYISVHNRHVSFEHTHPPHEYILSNNKFKKISDLKKEINEIIN